MTSKAKDGLVGTQMLHPVEALMVDPAGNAEEIVHWCVRTTGVVPSEPARAAAHALLCSGKLAGATLKDLVALWRSEQSLDELVYDVEHVALHAVEHWRRERAAR